MITIVNGMVDIYAMPVDSTPSLYEGQLVKSTGDGVGPLVVASGVADTANKQVIMGVVLGNNNRNPNFDSSVMAEKITGMTSQADQAARDYKPFSKQLVGDPHPMVQVGIISPQTRLRAYIWGSATVRGTALTTLTATVGSTDGLGFTSNATQFTPVSRLATTWCRSGLNKGESRISTDTSTTVETNAVAFHQDIAIGDTFVRAPIRKGESYVQLNSTSGAVGLWLDGTASPATNYFLINVWDMDLSVAGEEWVEFSFAPAHFDKVRA